MGVFEPGGALVVELGEGAVFEVGFGDAGRVEPVVRRRTSSRAASAMALTMGDSASEGSVPGGQGKGKVSKVESELYDGSFPLPIQEHVTRVQDSCARE